MTSFILYAVKVISDQKEGVKAVEVDLILGDMGKTPKARELAKEFSVEEKDHDIFLGECLKKKCPQIFPTFQNYLKRCKQTLEKAQVLYILVMSLI